MEGDKVLISETNKGKCLLLHKNYCYRRHITYKNGNIRWACLKEKKQKCKGSIITTNEQIIIKSNPHNCIVDEAAVTVKKQIQLCKKRAREESSSTTDIINEEITPLLNRGYDFVTAIPSHSALKRTLNRNKSKTRGLQKEEVKAKDIVLLEQFLRLDDESSFLVADEIFDEERLLVFATRKGLKALETAATIFVDGTFRSASKQFNQVYSIHIDIGSNVSETNVVPVVFALLESKKKITYERLFSSLKENIPNWSPRLIKIDFEMAAISSLKKIFPTAQISGCNYHFNQCLWRKVQHLGMTTLYANNPEVRLHVRMCAALAYIPCQDVEEGFLTIMESTPTYPELTEFYNYFVSEWMENENINIGMWNVYQQRHRSNNSVEGWNNRLNSALKKPHPHIQDLIQSLMLEAKRTDYFIDRQFLNLEGKRRKPNYVILDERIKRVVEDYEKTKDLQKCLKTLAFIQKLE